MNANDLILPPQQKRFLLTSAQTVDDPDSDLNAINIWLTSYQHKSPHTSRTFKKEAERFIMWLNAVKGLSHKHLPSVTADDMNQYRDFLSNPRSFSSEILAYYGRTEQPFRGPLSLSSARQAQVILSSMFDALGCIQTRTGDRYVRINPCSLLKGVKQQRTKKQRRYLTRKQWGMVLETIEGLPRETIREKAHYHRTRWVFQLLYRSFLRRFEAASLKMVATNGEPGFEYLEDGWTIYVVGKGIKEDNIPCPQKLMDEFIIYRRSLGLTPLPSNGEEGYAIQSITGEKKGGITAQALYKICEVIFQTTAERVREEFPSDAINLDKATIHWIRHTGISHFLDKDVNPRFVMAQSRHSSLKMMNLYDHKDLKDTRDAFDSAEQGSDS